MKYISFLIPLIGLLVVNTPIAFAASNSDVTHFTNQTLNILMTFASLVSVVFIIRGGFQYITSTGKPNELEHAKKIIRNALIGLLLVLTAAVFSSLLHNAFISPHPTNMQHSIQLTPIKPAVPSSGLTQVLIDAMTGFLQSIIQSATQPLVDATMTFLTTTQPLTTSSAIFTFWLVMVGIVDSLFALLIALLGFHIMSASTFGFDELEVKQMLPRIALAFIGANTSIFLIDAMISLCNTLVQAVLHTTGSLNNAWVLTAIKPTVLLVDPGGGMILTLIFMLLFVMLTASLLLLYISRLITLAVGAVLSPFLFLLWLLPGFTDFAIISMRSYLITIFTIFIHVVIIQLASAFLTLPGQTGNNPLISILVGISTLFILLKVPGVVAQFAFYSSSASAAKKIGGQIVNGVSAVKSHREEQEMRAKITERRTIQI